MKFDILEIQKFFEDKRIFYGQKFEKFILNFLRNISQLFIDKFSDFFSLKKSILFSCLIIILSSFLIRLNNDFGFRSAYLLDQIRYLNHFLFFPLNHFFASLIIFLSNKFAFDLKFSSEIIINLVGIFSLLICYKILFSKKDEFITKSILYQRHFLIFSACFSYFLRFYLIQFNEYLTFSGIFLALIWPFICLFCKNNKFHYIGLSFIFIALTAFLFPKFLLSEDLYNKNYLEIFRSDFLLTILFFAFTFSYVKTDNLLKTFLLLSTLSLIFSVFDQNFEFRSLFFAFIFPAVFYIIFLLIKDDKLNLKKNWLWILILIICAQFDIKNFISLTLNLSILWLIFLFKEIYFNKNKESFSFTKILTLTIFISYFISLVLVMILNPNNLYAASFKSPNYVSNQQYAIIQKYAPDDKILIISDELSDFYPLLLNLKLDPSFRWDDKTHSVLKLTQNNKVSEYNLARDVIRSEAEIQFLNNRIIFVRINNDCKIGHLENNFSDPIFKKNFLKNYNFLTTIEEVEKYKILRKVTNQESLDYEGFEEYLTIKNKFEVYIRKD